jgi:phospholipid N-methyltransferase
MINDALPFLREFVRHPLSVGAVAPSGTAVAERICTPVPLTGAPVIVELGPGTGAFTGLIQRRLAGRGHHLAIELNARFAARVARRYPAVDVIRADAADLVDLLKARGLAPADVIVSGLPWAAFPAYRQAAILAAVCDALADNGTFTTFAYTHAAWTPPGRRLRAALGTRFEEVVAGRTVWRNLPPAFVYHARRPLRAAGRVVVRAGSTGATSR